MISNTMLTIKELIEAVADTEELRQVSKWARDQSEYLGRQQIKNVRIGDTVSFFAGKKRGSKIGTVQKFGPKNVSIKVKGDPSIPDFLQGHVAEVWRVPPHMLTIVEANDA